MKRDKALRLAREYGAGSKAIAWLESLKRTDDPWELCERGDWMLWFAARHGVDRKLIVKAACKCARLPLRYVPDGKSRPLRAIETAEAWTRGEATIERVIKAAADASYAAASYAADASYAAADSAADAAASAAVSAAADAAAAAVSDASVSAAAAADAAVSAASAADADYAVYVAEADSARQNCLKVCANIVREIITTVDAAISDKRDLLRPSPG